MPTPAPTLRRQMLRRRPVSGARVAVGPSDDHLQRSLGTFLLTMFGVGETVGAGIFIVLSQSVPQAGPAVVISFLLAAIVLSVQLLWATFGRPQGLLRWLPYAFAPALIGFFERSSAINSFELGDETCCKLAAIIGGLLLVTPVILTLLWDMRLDLSQESLAVILFCPCLITVYIGVSL